MQECMYACTSRVSPEDDRVIEIEHEGERECAKEGRKAVLMALALCFKGDGEKAIVFELY